jgi:UDP-N-acetylmuramoyl-tripeptide--D-alanyl-D-alanine ligase
VFRLRDLVGVIPGAILLGYLDVKWENISIDSRTIKKGEVFFALKGEKYDGHNYIDEAIAKGACAIVLEKSFYQIHKSVHDLHEKNISPLLLVDNTLSALQLWAHHCHSLYKPLTICITGSNGKTTTKEMIVHLLDPKYNVLKSSGNYNNEIGVPLTLLKLDQHHDVLVLEMAARKLGEIKDLTGIVKPDFAIVTNVCEAHIGLFKSRENIAHEKSEIVLALKDKGTAILNRDDEYFEYLKGCMSDQNYLLSYGFHPEAQLRAENLWQDEEKGIHFDILFEEKKYHIFIPLLGRFNVYNFLAAFATGIKMHIPIEEMIYQISTFCSPKMRMEYSSLERGSALIQDCYNSNPTAVSEALKSVANISRERFKVAVLGDMLELGELARNYHLEIGKIAANLSFDLLIGFGDYANWIAQGALEQGMDRGKIYTFNMEEKDKIVSILKNDLPNNSIIFLKGSRGMQMEDIARKLKKTEESGEKSYNV